MNSNICTPKPKQVNNERVHPDQKYIEALLKNDKVLLNEVYQKFSGKIKWMVLQNNGTEDDAADIFQDALLFIYHKAKTDGIILTCPLEAFLYLICRNKWMSELHKRKSQNIVFHDVGIIKELGEENYKLLEQSIIQQSRKDLLKEKFSRLTASAQLLLSLSWSGKSMEEIARQLQVSYGYARKKKSAHIAKLIRLIKESPEFQSLKW